MVFDDIFYPGNPERRRQVALLLGQVRANFIEFHSAWNSCANLLNSILHQKYPQYTLLTLNCHVDNDCVQLCVDEINAVVKDTKPKLDKLLKDIGLEHGIPSLGGNLASDPEAQHKISQFITSGLDVAVSSFAAWYTYTSIRFFVSIINLAGASVSGLAEILGGVLGGMIIGAVAFVITDLIVSAISGAIERRELNDQIDALTKFREKCADPLLEAAVSVRGIVEAIQDGSYRLSDRYLLARYNGVYRVLDLGLSPRLTQAHVQALTFCSIRSVTFPNVYVRMDGRGVVASPNGAGIVNCQFGAGPLEKFKIARHSDGTVSFASAVFLNAFLRMDGQSVTHPFHDGAGTVNCQSCAGPLEKFRLESQSDGTYAIASVAFPGVYLRVDGRSVNRGYDSGAGRVNCQKGIGALEKFEINELH